MRPETTRRLLKATLLVSLLELALLRVSSRMGMHIPRNVPGRDLLLGFFSLVSSSGVIMYYVSYVLGFISLFVITWQGLTHPQKAARMTSLLILFLLMSTPLVEWMPTDALLSLAYDLASVGSIFLLSVLFMTSSRESSERAAAALFGLSYLSYYYFKISHAFFQFVGVTSTPPLVAQTLGAGELLIVINGLVLFIAHPRPRFSNKKALILSSALTMLYLTAHFIDPYAVSILAIWSLGLSLYLPFPCYAVALWFFSNTVLDRLWNGENIGYGSAFIFIAGFTLSLPHQIVKALLGLALLVPFQLDKPNLSGLPCCKGRERVQRESRQK